MACNSCDPGEAFAASYCDECERWTFRARQHHVVIGAALFAAAVVIVGVAIFQPELIAPMAALAGGALVKRALPFLA
jgi:cytochrome b subunit of formate dehydrogenase